MARTTVKELEERVKELEAKIGELQSQLLALALRPNAFPVQAPPITLPAVPAPNTPTWPPYYPYIGDVPPIYQPNIMCGTVSSKRY